jgi:Ca2+-binding EF-hand superfamily protein
VKFINEKDHSELIQTFKDIDHDQKGYITAEELLEALTMNGMSIAA